MTEKMFKFALRKSATLFFVAVFIVSTGFNLSMPFTARAIDNEETTEVVTTDTTVITEEAVETDNAKVETEKVETEPTEPEILGVTTEETVQNMITFCHLPPGNEGNPQTLTLPEHVYIDQGHPNHAGDHLGECTEEDEPEEEICGDGIDNDSDQQIDEDCTTECEIDPKKCEEEDKTATITAHKVLCDSEGDLPDWGNNGPSVTSTTAEEYVDESEGKCELIEWTFEWMPYDGTPVAPNGSTHLDDWTEFSSGTPTEIPLGERIWVREQMQNGYIPFSGDTTNDPYDTVSAEFYCATDVLHYDNLEFIDPVDGTNYHCVGFNVLEEKEQEVCEVTGPNLVQNGSFETPIPDVNGGGWEIFNTITGWLGGKVEIINGYDGWLADHLDQFATLDTCNCSDSSIYQNIATIPGKSYKVSFAHSPQPGYGSASNSIEFFWDEESIDTYSDNGTGNENTEWETENFEFVADDASSEIRFTGLGIKDGAGNFLDDVIVAECNPEEDRTGFITIDKRIFGGEKTIEDFSFFVGTEPVENLVEEEIAIGKYTVTETGAEGYITTFSGACNGDGDVTITEGEKNTCIITNTFDNGDQCVEGESWASEVITSAQGKRNDGGGIAATRSNPNNALGTPNGDGYAQTGFFSLGEGGSLTVKFDKYIENVDGDDLSFHEVTNERDSYPEENAKVEVSQDGDIWQEIGEVSSLAVGGVDYLDFDSTGWPWIQYVRITDTTDFSLNNIAVADGYDVDAIDATNGLCDEPTDEGGSCEETPKTYYSDSSVQVDGHDSVAVAPIHDAWDATIAGATWIWSENPITDAVNVTTKTFTKTFTIVGTPEDATLEIATDNTYSISVNGNPFVSDVSPDNFSTKDTHTILAADLVTGLNTLSITVTNLAQGGGTMATNPAGLLFKLVVSEDCVEENICVIGEELIKNGSFEAPEMTNGSGWDIFPSGAGTLEWLATWLSPDFDAPILANIEIQEDGLMGWTTPYGDQWVELDADYGFNANESSATRISQDIQTEVGATYKIKYAFGARPSVVDNAITVKADGVTVDTQSDDGTGDVNINWLPDDDDVTFVATDTTTTISFENTDTSDSLGSFLDEVSVKCIEDEGDDNDGGDDDDEDDGGSGGDNDGDDDDNDNGGGGGGGSSQRSSSSSSGEVLGESAVDGEVLAATGTESVSFIVLSGLILAFIVATKRRNSII